MTVKRIRLRNVQAHASLDIDLSPGITTLIGPSDAGKTAALRGAKWLALNKPSGDSLLRNGETSISARMEFDDETPTVTRKRDKKFNGYGVGDEVLSAIGQAVPPPVSDALRLTEDNFQGQMDPPYWLSLSPGDRARQFNDVVDLGGIDRALSAAAARVKATTQRTQDAEKRLRAAEAEVESLAYVADAVVEFEALEVLEADAYRTTKRIETLGARITEWDTWDAKITERLAGLEAFRVLVTRMRDVVASGVRLAALEAAIDELDQIDSIKVPTPAWRTATSGRITSYKADSTRLAAIEKAVEQYAATEGSRPNPAAVAATVQRILMFRETRQRLGDITAAIDVVLAADKSLETAVLEVARVRSDLTAEQDEVAQAIAKMPQPARCQTCQRPL